MVFEKIVQGGLCPKGLCPEGVSVSLPPSEQNDAGFWKHYLPLRSVKIPILACVNFKKCLIQKKMDFFSIPLDSC